MRLFVLLLALMVVQSCSSEGEKTLAAKKVNDCIHTGNNLVYEGKEINGDIAFATVENAVKNGPAYSAVYVTGDLVFKDCNFNGLTLGAIKDPTTKTLCSAIFTGNVYFENCIFKDNVDFTRTVFKGICTFNNCRFMKQAAFDGALFYNAAAFTKCTFDENAGFQDCTFRGNANFNNAVFSKTASFQTAWFYREAVFNAANFVDYTDFTAATFEGGISCNYVNFLKQAVFGNVSFKNRTEFTGCSFTTKLDMTGSLFYGYTTFEKSKIVMALILQNTKFVLGKPKTDGLEAKEINTEGAQYSTLSSLEKF